MTTWQPGGPGSARFQRAGDRILQSRTSLRAHGASLAQTRSKAPELGTHSPARYKRALPGTAAALLVLLCATSCRRGMVDQQKVKPLAENGFFADHRGSRVPPANTVARGELREDQQFYTGKIGNDLAATFPMPVTREVLERGQQRYNIYCAVCHGPTGDANGMIVERGFPQPPSFHEQRLRDAPPGHFVDVITNGYGVMYPYASRVAPADRWTITAYIRALQLSQHAAPADAEPTAAKQLETAQQ